MAEKKIMDASQVKPLAGTHTTLAQPLFSVVTITRNNLPGLQKTVKSVFHQTCRNFEHIIIDGASNDGSQDYLQEIAEKVPTVVSEHDNGIYDAMNKGLKRAAGEYVIFMNSGDCFADENVLAILGGVIEKYTNRPEFIYGDSYEATPDGRKKIFKKAKRHTFSWYGMFAQHQSMLFSMRKVTELGLVYQEKYPLAADWDFVVRFLTAIADDMRILRVNIPLSLFEVGGFSSNYRQGVKEQFNIRREALGWGRLASASIASLHLLLNWLRRKLPLSYECFNVLRSRIGGS